jgi:hypothetical protein
MKIKKVIPSNERLDGLEDLLTTICPSERHRIGTAHDWTELFGPHIEEIISEHTFASSPKPLLFDEHMQHDLLPLSISIAFRRHSEKRIWCEDETCEYQVFYFPKTLSGRRYSDMGFLRVCPETGEVNRSEAEEFMKIPKHPQQFEGGWEFDDQVYLKMEV